MTSAAPADRAGGDKAPPAAAPAPAEATAALRAGVAAAFADGGAIAMHFPGYEPRPGQRRLAAAVAGVLDGGGTLLAEAGTGTGKTLAYLVPAVLGGRRVLVSTGTKNLQEQIFFKDLPALRESLGVPFTATLMKGRSNYLCLHRWETYRDGVAGGTSAGGRLIEAGDHVLVPIIEAWAKTTATGDRAELRELPEHLPLWNEMAATAETCLGTRCPRYGDCFVTLMRQRAAAADIVIVNHHLLCADAAVRQSDYGEVIPACASLVVDEAHQLEDVATQYFGLSCSTWRADDLVRDGERLIARLTQQTGDEAGTSGAPDAMPRSVDEIRRALGRVGERARAFFAGIVAAMTTGAAEARLRYGPEEMAAHADAGFLLSGALDGLEAACALAAGGGARTSGDAGGHDAADAQEALATLQRRASELRDDLRFLLRADDPEYVYYVETRPRGVFLRAAPIDVSRVVRDALFTRFRTVILTSATLAVDGSFDYVRGRLGIDGADEVSVPSEFDFARQALLYLPRRMPAPREPGFAEAVARETFQLLRRSQGRAFVLFTSYAMLRTVQRFLEMTLPYPLLVQGTAPRSTLLERFRVTPHAVLLATSSFWQGVDVAGDQLSCVIVDKLPLASPTDPITAARIDAIRASGGDPFVTYQVPLAILALLQGLGRLIRHRDDRGVLAVLDPRLRTMGYGRRFLDALPPAPVTTDLRAVEQFFI